MYRVNYQYFKLVEIRKPVGDTTVKAPGQQSQWHFIEQINAGANIYITAGSGDENTRVCRQLKVIRLLLLWQTCDTCCQMLCQWSVQSIR